MITKEPITHNFFRDYKWTTHSFVVIAKRSTSHSFVVITKEPTTHYIVVFLTILESYGKRSDVFKWR